MAKMFYSLEEAQQILGRSEEEIKQLVQEGIIREFRDGPKIMYKVEEVDNLAASDLSGSGSGEIQLTPEDSGGQFDLAAEDFSDDISLAADDSGDVIGLAAGDSGEEIGLAADDSGEEIGLMPSDSADQISLEDTGQDTADEKDDTVITSHGTDALLDTGEDIGTADSLERAKTSSDFEDQIDLDSSSSGSGLLDLSREADDTSLGAELLEEIYPDAAEGAIETQVPGGLEMPTEADSMVAAEAQAPPVAEYVQIAPREDPTSGPFGAMMVVPMLMLIFLGFVTASALAGVRPQLLSGIMDNIWIVAGAAAAAAVLCVVVGMAMVGKASAPGEKGKKPKEKKAKKEKPKKEKKKKAKKKK